MKRTLTTLAAASLLTAGAFLAPVATVSHHEDPVGKAAAHAMPAATYTSICTNYYAGRKSFYDLLGNHWASYLSQSGSGSNRRIYYLFTKALPWPLNTQHTHYAVCPPR